MTAPAPMTAPILRIRAAGGKVATIRDRHNSRRLRFAYWITVPNAVRRNFIDTDATFRHNTAVAYVDHRLRIVVAGEGVGSVDDVTYILTEIAKILETQEV